MSLGLVDTSSITLLLLVYILHQLDVTYQVLNASSIKMPVCKFFTTKDGCGRGDQCRFQHVQLVGQGQAETTAAVGNREPLSEHLTKDWRRASTDSELPETDLRAEISCRYYGRGHCKNGDACRFRHDTPSEELRSRDPVQEARDGLSRLDLDQHSQDAAKLQRPKATESNARDLGGALVKFGPGAEVLSIEPTAASTARLQMCNVTCSWYQPSKIATLEFISTQAMEDAVKKLNRTKILNRKLECRTAVNKGTKPWQCFVKIGNLDVSTTPQMLKEACGQRRPSRVTFGESSYSSSAEEIGQAIERLLSSRGAVESWTMSGSKGTTNKATATFSTMEQATKAITDFNGYKLPQLGGSNITLSHMFKAKFSILSSLHSAIAPELTEVQRTLRSNSYLDIKAYPSADKAQRFTTLHIVSNMAQDVGKAKAAVEKILKGHIARGGKDIVWHEDFLTSDRIGYLNSLGKERDVFIYRDAKRCVLRLYGTEENKAFVESTLVKAVEDLEARSFKIELDDKVPEVAQRIAYRKIVAELGKARARLDVTTSPKTITIHGSSQDADLAKRFLLEYSGHFHETTAVAEESVACAVCWCDVEEMYKTPCGHAYDRDCFVNQCLSTADEAIPLRCLGSSGDCQAIISVPNLEAALTRDQLDKVLEASFTRHIRKNPHIYQYCPTAACDQVYEVSDEGKLFTCFTCLTTICSRCGAVNHEGLTCEQNKKAVLTDDAFIEWKKKNGAKDCPRCGSTIQKSEGCNHMECRVCRSHICWKCMMIFANGKETYDHLAEAHDGIFDPGYGD